MMADSPTYLWLFVAWPILSARMPVRFLLKFLNPLRQTGSGVVQIGRKSLLDVFEVSASAAIPFGFAKFVLHVRDRAHGPAANGAFQGVIIRIHNGISDIRFCRRGFGHPETSAGGVPAGVSRGVYLFPFSSRLIDSRFNASPKRDQELLMLTMVIIYDDAVRAPVV